MHVSLQLQQDLVQRGVVLLLEDALELGALLVILEAQTTPDKSLTEVGCLICVNDIVVAK